MTAYKVGAKDVVKYVVMPGIIPRFFRLFSTGFGHIAFLMAQIYAMVRLLPAGHPYLDPRNIGRYGLRHVVAEAANRLVLDKKNIDQIVIFALLLLAMVLLALQIILLIVSFIFGSSVAMAGTAWPYTASVSMFVTNDPADDIAFMLLDRVFGIPGFFGSCVSTGATCAGSTTASGPFPWPFHVALHQLFRFYSTGILLIGTIIFLYFIVVIVAETATTGTPFGQRFQNVWVPIRLVVAIGLLVPLPINYGGGVGSSAYSAGQYIVFGAAKYGSSLATNAWIRFNNAIYDHADFGTPNGMNPLGERLTMIALPKQPDGAIFAEMMSLMHTCAFTYYAADNGIVKGAGGIDYPDTPAEISAYLTHASMPVKPYLIKTVKSWMPAPASTGILVDATTTYQQALEFYMRGDIVIRFGRLKQGTTISPDNIEPTCGEIRIPVTDVRDSAGGAGAYPNATTPYLGAVALQQYYFNMVRDAWYTAAEAERFIDFAGRYTLLTINKAEAGSPCEMGCAGMFGENPYLPSCTGTGTARLCHTRKITAEWKQEAINSVQGNLNVGVLGIWNAYNTDGAEIAMDPAILDRGWGGAGIWFNRIAQVNGAWTAAVINQPVLDKYPLIMEEVRSVRTKNAKELTPIEAFNPHAAPDDAKTLASGLAGIHPDAERMATVMYGAYKYWHEDQINMAKTDKAITGSAVETAMNMIFGTYGMFAMTSENAQTHPLAQLTTLGRGLVEASIRNIAISTGSAAMGGAMAALSAQAGSLVSAAGGMFNSIAFLGLTAGIVLYYIVPFLPFIYFFFAVSSWIKTIFEAMVGVPLWALAHMRLSGDGLPGDAASNGYFLILEIFLRPILSVFGLVAALVIFTAQVRLLNFMWTLVTQNVGGFNAETQIAAFGGNVDFKRSVVDEFFFTITYTMVVYMMATAAFKLVDTIPDNILRWAGQGVSSFGDINQDTVGELTRYAALGGLTAGREAVGGIQKIGAGIGGAAGAMAKSGQGLASSLKNPFTP